MSMFLALSMCPMLISLIQSVNIAQFSNVNSISLLFTGWAASAVFGTVAVSFLLYYSYIIENPLSFLWRNLSLFYEEIFFVKYLFLGVSLSSPIFSASFVIISKLFCGEVF